MLASEANYGGFASGTGACVYQWKRLSMTS